MADLWKGKGLTGRTSWEILALLCVLAYWPMFANGFVWDDSYFIVGNPALRGLLPLSRFFVSHGEEAKGTFNFLVGDRAVMLFSLALDYALWGLKPLGYHLTQLALHLLCVFGVALLVRTFTRSTGAAFLSGALFALHPGHAEAVIAFAGRSDLLSTLFVLLGFLSYARFQESRGVPRVLFYLGSLASLLLACFSKETGLVLLGLLAVYEGFGVGRARSGDLKTPFVRLAPFFLLGVFYWIHRARVLGGQFQDSAWWGGSPYKNFLMSFEVFASYFRLWFFPLSLSPLHTLPVPAGFWDLRVLLGLSLLLLSLAGMVWTLWKSPRIGFFVVWALFGLLPVMNFVPVPGGIQILNEHRLYLASIGTCALGGWGGWTLFEKLKAPVRTAWAALIIMILAIFGIRTFLWNHTWRNGERIGRAIIATAPRSPLGYNNLGVALRQEGRTDEAIAVYRKGIGLAPKDTDLFNNLGVALRQEGKTGEAIAAYRQALELAPDNVRALENLAGVLDDTGRREEADVFWRRALRVETRPDWIEKITMRLTGGEAGKGP